MNMQRHRGSRVCVGGAPGRRAGRPGGWARPDASGAGLVRRGVRAAALSLTTAALVCGLASSSAFAQPGGHPGGPPGGPDHGLHDLHPERSAAATAGAKALRKRVHARIAAMRAELLRKEVGLDDKRAKRVEALLKTHEAQRRALERRLRGHTRAMHLLLRSGSDDQKAYKRAIDGVLAARRDLSNHRTKEFTTLRSVLAPKEQAQLLMGLQRLKRRAHRVIERARKAHMEQRARRMMDRLDKPHR